MSKKKILVVWSNYYKDLAQQQLQSCIDLLKHSEYDYTVEIIDAGSYEIPAVIRHYHHNKPYDAYIALGLLLKGRTDHYEFIWEHLKTCFIQFAMEGILLGNAVISAPNMEIMTQRVVHHERVEEAFRAVHYLLQMKEKIK